MLKIGQSGSRVKSSFITRLTLSLNNNYDQSPTVHRNLGQQRTVSFLIPLGGSAGDQKILVTAVGVIRHFSARSVELDDSYGGARAELC